ncbi:MAG TPA: TonB-dependent receptor [Candidatus Avacidaminococcus intestinavium]|uniref:TonB-dependent receptor n=1 Tax=Candidatus Avacidaminococcus intestinavium TaxID=2840684 RepID=A0A9D1SLR6_9FIRM|nr:TonB-dependent receptor [Candidatus Avacidaminococcus intestinavium]
MVKKRALNKSLILSLVLAGTTLGISCEVSAEEAVTESFTLDKMIVTATRYEKKDLEIAAATEVLTRKRLDRTGARNVQQALAKVNGIVYQAKGPGGGSLGSMTSKVSMRGVEKGTLVLLNGSPVNWRGLYNLEDIPLDNVERIEIVRGGGSVLYGSEAMGGVINIILKKEVNNSVKAGIGNRGQQNYNFSTQQDKLSFSYNYDKWGNLGKVSSTLTEASKPTDKEMYNRFKGSEKNDFKIGYKLSDYVDFNYNHGESNSKFAYTYGKNYGVLEDIKRYDRNHERTKDFLQFNFEDKKGLKGNLYYNFNQLHSTGTDYYNSSAEKNTNPIAKNSKEKNLTYGYDVQKVWNSDRTKLLFGTTYTREEFEDYEKNVKGEDYSRNNFSVYGQWEKNINTQDILTLSARETWTTGAAQNKNYDNFSAQGQYLRKIDATQSIYLSVGQSFTMPSFSNMYSAGNNMVVGDPNLKPQKGIHYEMGWKKDHEDHKWRLAIFNYKITDNISFSKTGNKYYAINEDLKNTGIEFGVDIAGDNGWSYNYGLTFGNPKSKSKSEKVGTKDYWDRAFGRWQIDGGISYSKEKWDTSLTASYLAARVLTPSSSPAFKTKPYLLTTLSTTYKADKHHQFNLSIENILDRKDNINHSSSAYYSAPINYMFSYQYNF